VGPGKPPIAEEWAYLHQAMHDHLVATGNIAKVMGVNGGELAVQDPTDVPDYNHTNFYKGAGLKNKIAAAAWAESGVQYYQSTLVDSATKKPQMWPYMHDPVIGMAYPDMKMTSTGSGGIGAISRFDDLEGNNQKDIRPLRQATEANGLRDSTTFVAGVPNPWGYSNQIVPQTPMHILWALSGAPKAADPAKRDSGLGQAGEDPPGIMPVHLVSLSFDVSWSSANYPTAEQWREAIDTFGPPGTFAFPYLPPGYEP
jgi:hypothetical protein